VAAGVSPTGWLAGRTRLWTLRLVVERPQVHDLPGSDGQWTEIFDYDRLVFEDERLEARNIVKTVRRVEAIVRNGIARLDEDKIF
jgi:hypothetical protein